MSDEGRWMPDSPDFRIGQLEQKLAGVLQRTEDHENDIRALGPLVVAHARLEEKLSGIQEGLTSLRGDWRSDVEHFESEIKKLRSDLDADRKDRDRVRAEREERERERERVEREKEKDREIAERRDKIIRWLTFAALLVAAVSSTAAVINL